LPNEGMKYDNEVKLVDHEHLTREEMDKLWWNLLSDVLSEKQKGKVGKYVDQDERRKDYHQ